MATNIEQRVVQMRFDNAQFEKGIAQSYNSLDRFEKKLNFKGAAKGLESVQQTANQLSFDNLDKQIGVIEVSFNALSVVATQALTRITGAAMDTAAGLAKAFTLDMPASNDVENGFLCFASHLETEMRECSSVNVV